MAGKPEELTGVVTGTALLWARARFEHKQIQINKYNKLTLEVFSRMSAPIRIQKLTISMSVSSLNQEIDFSKDPEATTNEKHFNLCKKKPIKRTCDFYLEADHDFGFIRLNQIRLELAPPVTAAIEI